MKGLKAQLVKCRKGQGAIAHSAALINQRRCSSGYTRERPGEAFTGRIPVVESEGEKNHVFNRRWRLVSTDAGGVEI